MVGMRKVVIDSFGNSDDPDFITYFTGKTVDFIRRIHGVITADIEEITDLVLFKCIQQAGEVFFPGKFVAAGSQSCSRCIAQPFNNMLRLPGKIKQVFFQNPADAKEGPVNNSGRIIFQPFLDHSTDTAVDYCGRPARLSHDRVAPQFHR